jgi:hypothetical protein
MEPPWWLLVTFQSDVQISTQPSTTRVDIHGMERLRRQSFFSPLFYLVSASKRCVDLVKIQTGPQSSNYIEFDLLFFLILSLTFDFLCFFYQI